MECRRLKMTLQLSIGLSCSTPTRAEELIIITSSSPAGSGFQEIKAGDKVSIWYISANRDEEVFDDPFTFDITRDPNEHVGFGGGGPHHCLGSNLARMEIYVLLEEMARRMPKLELVGDAQPLRSNFIAGIKHMPVKYPAGKREVS